MNHNQEMPLTSTEEARDYINEHFSDKDEVLLISDSLNDNMGINMAVIIDRVLQAGYMPDGFEQKEGYRIYKYKKD